MRVQATTFNGAPANGGASGHAGLGWRVGLFHPSWRAPIMEVARQHPALADLAESYPALLFALASGFGAAASRQAAVEALLAGEPLQAVAERLGLAFWTRKLPASSLRDPLPMFPSDADFSRRMANLVPDGVNSCALWLTAVSEAVPAGGRQYALWIARHGVALMGTLSETQRQAFHAWVWMGWHPGTLGHSLVRRPWASDLGIKRVMDEFGAFLARAGLADALGDGRLGGISEASVHGLLFKPLRSAFAYIEAAAALDNCLEQYADRVKRGTCAVAVIIEGASIVGCVEIGPHPTESAMPAIIQLRTAKNRRGSAVLWSAAYAWLAACDMRPLIPQALAPSDGERARVRAALWAAFLSDIAAAPGCAAFYERARTALDGEPPALDAPGFARHLQVRGTMDFRPEYATLFERLANLAGRHGRNLR